MRPFAVDPEDVTESAIAGAVLCHDIVVAGDAGRIRLNKGSVLTAVDAPTLRNYPGELHLLSLGEGDVHEDAASTRLATAVMGEGLEMHGPVESQTHLRATCRGLFEVDVAALEQLNLLPDVSVFTVYSGQPVDRGKAVAATKITPLAIPESVVQEAEAIARGAAPLMRVCPFGGGEVGVIVRERIASTARERFEAAIHMKLGWFGSSAKPIRYLPEDTDVIADAVTDLLDSGVVLILAAGVNSTDPLDLTLRAIERIGAETELRGVPAHPGSTCWLAHARGIPIFGLALCGMFSRTTVLDLLLPRFLSGRPIHAEDIARLGHGGLLSKDMSFRFPNYDKG